MDKKLIMKPGGMETVTGNENETWIVGKGNKNEIAEIRKRTKY
jgi:hypothetical protein